MNTKCHKRVGVMRIAFMLFTVLTFSSRNVPAVLAKWDLPSNHTALEICDSSLDYCTCTANDVLVYNEEVFAYLNKIVQEPYFRYFKVHLSRACPFWAVSLLCSGESDAQESPCSVHKCASTEIPSHLKHEKCADEIHLPPPDARDFTIQNSNNPMKLYAHELGWDHPASGSWMHLSDGELMEGQHIDLTLNPESNTFYRGILANRIWHAVYLENCFTFTSSNHTCTKEELFYRLISGLHTSISVHLSVNFSVTSRNVNAYNVTQYAFSENMEEFDRRVGQHPERIRNLMTLYLFVARSVTKVKSLLMQQEYRLTDDEEEQNRILSFVQKLTEPATRLCNQTFDESKFIQDVSEDEVSGLTFIDTMQLKLQNITRLMDCLTCEKCRLWGKLQTLGLGTAVRIILSEVDSKTSSDVSYSSIPRRVISTLQRSEIVVLINFFRQLAFSIFHVQRLMKWPFDLPDVDLKEETMGSEEL